MDWHPEELVEYLSIRCSKLAARLEDPQVRTGAAHKSVIEEINELIAFATKLEGFASVSSHAIPLEYRRGMSDNYSDIRVADVRKHVAVLQAFSEVKLRPVLELREVQRVTCLARAVLDKGILQGSERDAFEREVKALEEVSDNKMLEDSKIRRGIGFIRDAAAKAAIAYGTDFALNEFLRYVDLIRLPAIIKGGQ